MLFERAELLIAPGSEAGFAEAMSQRGLQLLSGVAGVKSVSMGQGVENRHKFMLLVEWESMDAHLAFPKTPTYRDFIALIRPFSTGGSMEHFEFNLTNVPKL
jgi:heme-degrading monooxygenase HmoA